MHNKDELKKLLSVIRLLLSVLGPLITRIVNLAHCAPSLNDAHCEITYLLICAPNEHAQPDQNAQAELNLCLAHVSKDAFSDVSSQIIVTVVKKSKRLYSFLI